MAANLDPATSIIHTEIHYNLLNIFTNTINNEFNSEARFLSPGGDDDWIGCIENVILIPYRTATQFDVEFNRVHRRFIGPYCDQGAPLRAIFNDPCRPGN